MAYRESFESCPRCAIALEDAGAVRVCTQCGSGRFYGWDYNKQQLYVEWFSDNTRARITESDLAEVLAESPQVFNDVRYE